MILDSSSIVAVILEQKSRASLIQVLVQAQFILMSAFSLHEAGTVVLRRRGPEAVKVLNELIAELGVRVVPFTPAEASVATSAYERYGKGLNPPGLNMGDCAVYALAHREGVPV